MRTTVTLDPDVEELLRETAHQQRISFKRVLNDAVRTALQPKTLGDLKPFVVEPTEMGLRMGLDLARAHEVAADLEAEAYLERTRKLEVVVEK